MTEPSVTRSDQKILLDLARHTITAAAEGLLMPPLCVENYSERLRRPGASFVTLSEFGQLRGCVGTLEAYQTLVEDVCEHAEAAAFHDYRFPPVRSSEIPDLRIEISCLTEPQPLEYSSTEDLLSKLRPEVDGVMLRDGFHRATFLPQVWENLPDPADFLNRLCQKMGASESLWRKKHLQVLTYQVECFEEEDAPPAVKSTPSGRI